MPSDAGLLRDEARTGPLSAADRRARTASGLTSRLILDYAERQGGRAAVDRILDLTGLRDREAELRDERTWFGPETKAALWDAAAEALDDPDVARHVGAAILDFNVAEGLKRALRAFGSPHFVLRNIVRANTKFSLAYRLEAVSSDNGRARVRLVDLCGVGYDRRECDYVCGLMEIIPRLFGLPAARVEHHVCGVHGDPFCEFDVHWEPGLRGLRRAGAAVGAASVVLAGAGATVAPPLLPVAGVVAVAGGAVVGGRAIGALRGRVRGLEQRVVDQDVANEQVFRALADLSTDLRLDEVLDKIGQRADVAVAHKQFVLLLAEDDHMAVARHSGLAPATLEAVAGWVQQHRGLLDGEPLLLDDLAAVPALSALPEDPVMTLGSLCCAPLRSGDQLLGALVALAHGTLVFLPHETAAFGAYAAQAAIALSNAHLVARLERQAAEDPLTSLANQRAFHRACAAAFAAAERDERPVAIVAVDLDHFKSINDDHGHLYGDEVLRRVGAALRSAAGPHDTVARLGGEEFALLLVDADGPQAVATAERARAAIAEVRLPDRVLTASAGVASHPACLDRRERLMALADRALYEAKELGRNQTVEHQPATAAALTGPSRAELEALLAPGGLQIVFQPIVLLVTGGVICHEVLSRFPSLPDRPIPEVFSAAHAAGLGARLEAHALRTALASVDDRQTAISVNLSVRALSSPDVWEVLPESLTGVIIEITEDELFGVGADLHAALGQLRDRGARIAVDDAGAGYSGLQQLIQVRPDIVKLDRALVAGVARDPARAALVASFAAFATQTGGSVCAEGIEDEADLRTVADLDIAYAQGFLLGRPDPEPITQRCPAAAAVAARTAGGLRAFDLVPEADAFSLGGSVPERLATMIATSATADRIDLWRFDPRTDELVAVRVPDHAAGDRVALGGFPAREHVVRAGQPGQVLLVDGRADATERALLEAAGYRCLLLVPLLEAGTVLGLVACYRRRTLPWSRDVVARVRARAAPLVAVLSGGLAAVDLG